MARADEIYGRIRAEGPTAIEALITDFQSENLWLDFKRSADQGASTRLHPSDRENLARAVSGFGNSDGGVIVWGVDCRRDVKTGADVPGDRYPIQRPARFVSWLENAVSSCTTPAHSAVEHQAVSTNDTEGYVVSLIPSNLSAPLQCIQPTTRLQYYMRAGSSFVLVPHAVLAGLFGRRPAPRIVQKWLGPSVRMRPPLGGDASLPVLLTSNGRAIARDVYMNLFAFPPGPGCMINFRAEQSNWESHDLATNAWSVISRESLRVAPGASVIAGVLHLELNPPFERPLIVEMSYGCEGAERRQWRIDSPPSAVAMACEQLNKPSINGNEFIELLLGPNVSTGEND